MENGNHETGIRSFSYALKGLAFVFRSELNARIHTAIAILVVVMGIVLGISRIEWIIIILCIGIVFAAEILNTSIERLVDIVSPQISEKAGIVKDIAAGAVLLSAVFSVITGFLIFIPYLKQTFYRLFS